MLGLIKWLNPAYPVFKLLGPVVRRPDRALTLAGKPVANASSALLQRNREVLELEVEGDVEGTVTITVPYDEDTLNKLLAISLLPQVALLASAYAIPSLQRDLNAIWRTATLGRGGNLPRWSLSRDLMGRKIKREVAETVGKKAAQRAAAPGLSARIAANVGSRAAGSFIAGVNVLIWIDTAILVTTGIADLLIPEEMEEGIGVDIQMWSPLDEVITALVGWTAEELGVGPEEIIRVGEQLGIDDLVKGGLFMLGDIVLDVEQTTIETDLRFGDQTIDLDLDGYTFGQVMALAIQYGGIEEAVNLGWDEPSELMQLFYAAFFSLLLIGFGRELLRLLRNYAA